MDGPPMAIAWPLLWLDPRLNNMVRGLISIIARESF